jgi:glycosyltransferase A (GT-A) superfamily protein (DUF2064 family)
VEATIAVIEQTGLPFAVSLAGDPRGSFAQLLRARGLTVWAQGAGDLGARMAYELRRGPGRRLVVGTDCLVLEPAWVHEALRTPAEIALGPTEDGGYWGIALDRDAPADRFTALFEHIPWSTPQVLPTTLARCCEQGWSPHLLPTAWDVDEPPELARLLGHPRCPATVRSLLSDLRPS